MPNPSLSCSTKQRQSTMLYAGYESTNNLIMPAALNSRQSGWLSAVRPLLQTIQSENFGQHSDSGKRKICRFQIRQGYESCWSHARKHGRSHYKSRSKRRRWRDHRSSDARQQQYSRADFVLDVSFITMLSCRVLRQITKTFRHASMLQPGLGKWTYCMVSSTVECYEVPLRASCSLADPRTAVNGKCLPVEANQPLYRAYIPTPLEPAPPNCLPAQAPSSASAALACTPLCQQPCHPGSSTTANHTSAAAAAADTDRLSVPHSIKPFSPAQQNAALLLRLRPFLAPETPSPLCHPALLCQHCLPTHKPSPSKPALLHTTAQLSGCCTELWVAAAQTAAARQQPHHCPCLKACLQGSGSAP